jgi:D-ribose pyranose/furanose isomerase RbsD
VFFVVLLAVSLPAHAADWKQHLAEAMPLLGHRNWILVVDSAYPLQISPGIETVETNASQLDVVKAVLDEINRSIQVRPVIFMDVELPYISDADAPGIAQYRIKVEELLKDLPVRSLPHEKIISNIDEAGKTFHVLVLKTNMTIPYTSVFLRLDCKYWSAEQERNLRSLMQTSPHK